MAAFFSTHTEFFIFAALCTAAFGIQGFWLRKAKSAQLPWPVWAIAAVLLAVTWQLADQAGNRERQRIQRFTQDFARLYGSEMEKRGHAKLGDDAGADDPLYLDLIATEKRWLGLSPSVNDIYTFRKRPDGKTVLIVDSETDYDRNGKYEGEREQRTAIGEVYEEADAALEQAFLGEPAFAFEPITDRWGTWVSAFVPLHAPDGRIEAVLGVDFEAKVFTRTIAAAQWRMIGLMAVVQLILLGASTLTSVMHADNAARRLAAEALRKNEAQLQTIVENLAEGVAVFDLDGQLLHFNWAALAMHGFSSLEEARLHVPKFAELFDLADMNGAGLPLEQWPLSRILNGENLRDVEVRVRRPKAGWTRVFSYRGSLVYDATGRSLMAVVTISDVTERKRSEAALEKAHRDLVDVSRQAGMAEVATSVLHNVGNVLNSTNVSLEIATTKVRQLKAASLGKSAALLHEHAGDLPAFFANPQGSRFPAFLSQLAEHFTAQQAAVLGELDSLRTNVEHINQIVAMQQSYASAGGVIEELPVAGVIEDALRINSAALDRHGTAVVRDFDPALGAVSLDRHKILQILVNLIGNAKYAMDEPEAAGKALTIRTAKVGADAFSIAVLDQGTGIAPEQLTHIFQHGFTTKKDGHGFGLHASALSARQMHGELRVESAGRGCGATFTLTLPLRAQAA